MTLRLSSDLQQAIVIHDFPPHSSKSRKKVQIKGDGFIHAKSRRRMAVGSSYGKKMLP